MSLAPSPQVVPALRVVFGDDVGRVHVVTGAEVLIGRSPACHVRLDQPSVSRVHAKIVEDRGRLVLRDCGSTNGTHLDDVAVAEAELAYGARVKIGRTIFELVARHGTADGAVPPPGQPPPSSPSSAPPPSPPLAPVALARSR
jgi:S-DNA-T family DNA segregation ATPase FtsK/SpoIIIE